MERPAFSTNFAGNANAGLQVGVNTGSITNHFQTNAPVLSSSPSIVVPCRRDRDFVHRPVLDDIWRSASEPAARVGVFGLGGVGKTQLAIEYAYRRREADLRAWVFWVHASSKARFEESYRQIALQIHMDSPADPKADILSLVYAWLSDEHNGPWTMVVDNADSDTIMFGSRNNGADISTGVTPSSNDASSGDRSLADLLPTAIHGSIVITSRSRAVVEGVIEYATDIFEVKAMTEIDAIALLTKKHPRSVLGVEQPDSGQLVRVLDYMPLAITQAAAYIHQLSPRMTVSKYLAKLTTSDTDRDKLLQQDVRDPRRDGRASNSIIFTWHTSFEHIRQTRSSAARLLALMSLFDREGIPEAILLANYGHSEDEPSNPNKNVESTADEYDFEQDIKTLNDYSLIGFGTNERLFDMHRLVQFSTRKWLELRKELAYWQERYIDILGDEFPLPHHSNWLVCEALFPHMETMLSCVNVSDYYLLKRARSLRLGANYAAERARYGTAAEMVRAILNDMERIFGHDDSKTLHSASCLSKMLLHQGYLEQAKQLSRRAAEGLMKSLGTNHILTTMSLQDLGVQLVRLNKHEEVEQHLRRALAGYEEHLGVNHPHTLGCVSDVGYSLLCRTEYEEAEKMCRRALLGLEQVFGANHVQLLRSTILLGQVRHQQQDYQEALQLLNLALPLCLNDLGPTHPMTLECQRWITSALAQIHDQNR